MPRINYDQGDYTPKPTGVLTAKVTDCAWLKPGDEDIPKWNRLCQDPSLDAILSMKIMPDGHDREQQLYIRIKLKYDDDGKLNAGSQGVKDINDRILDSLGFKVAGFQTDGSFFDEDGTIIQFDDIGSFIYQEIQNADDFKIVIYIYKQATQDGKTYFRCSPFFWPNTKKGHEDAEWSFNKNEEKMKTLSKAVTPPVPAPTTAAPQQGVTAPDAQAVKTTKRVF